ncbi:MAG: FAD-binding oxidoreductase [Candidatus Acidiferrum sp.]
MTEEPAGLLDITHWQTAKVVEIVVQTPRIKSFLVEPLKQFVFRAGQHVDLRLTAPDGYRAIRSYSIASSPEDLSRIELAIERLDRGEVSPFFHDVVAVGDEIELRGPLGGHFIWSGRDGGPLLLIGGGSGVVPLVSMVRHRMATSNNTVVVLLLSARTWDEIPFRDELLTLHSRQNGFTLVLTLTRDAPRRVGDYGRRIDPSMISEVLSKLPSKPDRVFVCGSNPFVNAATDGVTSSDIPSDLIKVERYGS